MTDAGQRVEVRRGADRFVTVAELDIWAEAARLQEDVETALGVGAEDAVAGDCFAGAAGRGVAQLHGVLALGIVRAADEGAELAQLER